MSAVEWKVEIGKARVVTMRELSQRTAQVMNELNHSRRPALVTRHGRFQAIIYPVAKEKIESFVLQHLDEFVGTQAFDEQETEADAISTEEAKAALT